MSKFHYFDPQQTIIDMCEGNPGAISAMCCMNNASVGRQAGGQWPWEMVKICDELEIYGSRLYQLWNDCLGRDTGKMAALARELTGPGRSAPTPSGRRSPATAAGALPLIRRRWTDGLRSVCPGVRVAGGGRV